MFKVILKIIDVNITTLQLYLTMCNEKFKYLNLEVDESCLSVS